MSRALAVSDNVIALRNPKAETQIQFERRAYHLHDELSGFQRDEYSRAEPIFRSDDIA